MRLVVSLAVQRHRLLHAQHGLHTQYGVQVGVLATRLLSASPPRVAEDVDVRTPEGQLRIARIVRHPHRYVVQLRVVMVGTVPVGTCLVRNLREHVVHQLLAEGCSQSDGLGIDGIVHLAHTVTGLAPPVVRRYAQPVDRYALVHHQPHLLFRCQHAQQVLYALGTRQLRVLPGILVLCTCFRGTHGYGHHCQ